jgi:squalene monooxygenase
MINKVCCQLPEPVQKSFLAAIEEQRMRSMPNSWLPPTSNNTRGVLLVGDCINMRHPLTGGGMTVALNDVVLIRNLLSIARVPNLNDLDTVSGQVAKLHWQRKSLASVINILAQALYALFSAGDGKSFCFHIVISFFCSIVRDGSGHFILTLS